MALGQQALHRVAEHLGAEPAGQVVMALGSCGLRAEPAGQVVMVLSSYGLECSYGLGPSLSFKELWP